MAHTMSLHDLRDALAQPGCAVCRLKTDSAERFLDGLLWESVNDPVRRRGIRQAQGFCHNHAWALVRSSASLGVAIIMRDVLQNVLRTLEEAAFEALPSLSWRHIKQTLGSRRPSAATSELVAQLEPRAACPACVMVERTEGMILDTLVASLLGEGDLLTVYRASDGLCLPHFRETLARVRERETFEALVSAQRAIWERLVGHLDESIRKSDHRFLNQAWGEEAGAWLRAIAALVGAPPERSRR